MVTTREDSDVIGVFYSHERAPGLGYSSVTVSIPPNHVAGNLERAKKLPPNPETEFAIVDPVKLGAANDEELAGLGVTVIDLSDVENSTSGTHSKLTGSPEVVQLIGKSLRQDNFNKPPRSPTLVEVLDGIPVLNVLIP